MTALRILALVCVLAALLPAAAPPRVDPRTIAGDAHDLLLFHPTRPYRLRLHLQVDRRSFLAEHRRQMEALFVHLDGNGNGVISQTEAAIAPSRRQLGQLLRGLPIIEPDTAPPFADLKGRLPLVQLASLTAYYDSEDPGPIQFQLVGHMVGEEMRSQTLWRVLDTNGDGKLSKAELDAASRVLARLDRNGDELVTLDELALEAQTQRQPAMMAMPKSKKGPSRARVNPIDFLRPGTAPVSFLRSFMQRYDTDGDDRLTAKEVGLPGTIFRWLDADRDARLDASELPRWLEETPDASILVPLENQPRRAVEMIERHTPTIRTHPTRDGVWLSVADHAVEIRRLDGRQEANLPKTEADTVFRLLDGNGDGLVDSREIQTPPFAHVSWLRLADRDGDGQLSRKEFDAFVDLQRRLRGVATYLALQTHDRELFRLLDADQDGALGLREQRYAWTRVAPWAKDGTITPGQLPLQFRVTLSHGQPLVTDVARTLRRGGQMAGPLWFNKMDSNGDGDISPREWLGTREQFREIDTDGDGLLSLAEAAAADRKARGR